MKLTKNIIFIIFSFIPFSGKAQNDTALIGKSFIARIGSVCEIPLTQNNCVGYEIFLEIKFDKNNIEILRKEINSCRQIIHQTKIFTEWTFERPDKIIILKMSKDMGEDAIYVINSLIYKNGILTGKTAYPKNEIIFNAL